MGILKMFANKVKKILLLSVKILFRHVRMWTNRVATNLENSVNSKNCQNLKENSRKFKFLQKIISAATSPMKMYSSKFPSLELLRENYENTLEFLIVSFTTFKQTQLTKKSISNYKFISVF